MTRAKPRKASKVKTIKAKNSPNSKKCKSKDHDPIKYLQTCKSMFRRNTSETTADQSLLFVGRVKEREFIEKFIQTSLEKKAPNSLYICGAPGTGKTALVEQILSDRIEALQKSSKKKAREVNICKLNCMSVGLQTKSIFRKIYNQLCPNGAEVDSNNTQTVIDALEEFLVAHKGLNVVFLDEIDQLLLSSKNQDILYRIFEWPWLKQSSCVLIGIANTLDLTKRFLPRLQSSNCEPSYLAFPAFTSDEISDIITARLKAARLLQFSSNAPENLLIHKTAVALCAKKVSSFGDLRKAFDISRLAIEIYERELRTFARNTALSKNFGDENDENSTPKRLKMDSDGLKLERENSCESPVSLKAIAGSNKRDIGADEDCFKINTSIEKLLVQPKHMIKAIDRAFGNYNQTIKKIQSFTPHQKSVMVILALIEQYNRQVLRQNSQRNNQIDIEADVIRNDTLENASLDLTTQEFDDYKLIEPTVMRVYETFLSVSKKTQLISNVSWSEFFDLFTSIESSGLINIGKKGPSSIGSRSPFSWRDNPKGTPKSSIKRGKQTSSNNSTPKGSRLSLGSTQFYTPPSNGFHATSAKNSLKRRNSLSASSLLPGSASRAGVSKSKGTSKPGTPLQLENNSVLKLLADYDEVKRAVVDSPNLAELLVIPVLHLLGGKDSFDDWVYG